MARDAISRFRLAIGWRFLTTRGVKFWSSRPRGAVGENPELASSLSVIGLWRGWCDGAADGAAYDGMELICDR